MKNLKALLVMGTAAIALSSCETNRPSYPSYNNYDNLNVPVPVRYGKDGYARGAYSGDNGHIAPSTAEGTSMVPTSSNIIFLNGAPDLPRGYGETIIAPRVIIDGYHRYYPRRIHSFHNNYSWGWSRDCTRLGNCR